jgi:hypothetical protein
VVIIGAGPAGLTAGYLPIKGGGPCRCPEADPVYVGGISRHGDLQGFQFDIGGHRFFPSRRRSKICGRRSCLTTCSCDRGLRAFLRRQIFLLSAETVRSTAETWGLQICPLHAFVDESAPVPSARPTQFRGMGKQSIRQTSSSNTFFKMLTRKKFGA